MHKPVMVNEVVELLAIRESGTYIDGTLGEGGHASAILQRIGDKGWLIGIDRDAESLLRARRKLARCKSQCFFEHGNFADLAEIAEQRKIESVDGILFDLGMSSFHVDSPDRGFSFMHDGPLDMRMDRTQKKTASDLITSLNFKELADLIWTLGEEPFSRRIAKAIVTERERNPVFTTRRLADLIVRVKGGRRGKKHPATRTFQAIRMALNQELECLAKGLEHGIAILKQGGRMAVLSYHSLEDRSVKKTFARHVGRWESQPAGGESWLGIRPVVRCVNKKPLTATIEEIAENSRARSAKLRVIERI